ncbi:MAG: hypothetical protein U0Y68_02400 [Blastocatellia bacterium]
MNSSAEKSSRWQQVIGLLLMLLLLYASWMSGRIGIARLSSEYAVVTSSVAAADTALAWSPTDPQAHFARAAALADHEQSAAAITAFQVALQRKPRDYYFWLKLARTQDWAGQEGAARASYASAVRLAPYYAAPRWELGNLLLRAGADEEAFAELRRAAHSNSTLLPAVIDLAYNTYTGDRARIGAALQSSTPEAQLELARYFSKRGKLGDALSYLDAAGNEEAEVMRQAWLSELFYQRQYPAAYQVWRSHPARKADPGLLTDGSFEGELTFDQEAWFGWQLSNTAAREVKAAVDPQKPRAGQRSLRLEWSGDPKLTIPILSQLAVVEPNQSYRLRFAARTETLISAGMPYLAVAVKNGLQLVELGQSALLPRDGENWREYSVEFTAPPETHAVTILLRRQCETTPCPIYGRLWLDDFMLQPL